MHIAKHIIINSAIALSFKLEAKEFAALVAGGVIIDFDHPLYYASKLRTKSFRQIKKSLVEDFNKNKPNLYLFHTFEFLSLLLYFGTKLGGAFQVFALGFIIHLLTDMYEYLKVYKPLAPRFKYLLLSYFLIRPRFSK